MNWNEKVSVWVVETQFFWFVPWPLLSFCKEKAGQYVSGMKLVLTESLKEEVEVWSEEQTVLSLSPYPGLGNSKRRWQQNGGWLVAWSGERRQAQRSVLCMARTSRKRESVQEPQKSTRAIWPESKTLVRKQWAQMCPASEMSLVGKCRRVWRELCVGERKGCLWEKDPSKGPLATGTYQNLLLKSESSPHH